MNIDVRSRFSGRREILAPSDANVDEAKLAHSVQPPKSILRSIADHKLDPDVTHDGL